MLDWRLTIKMLAIALASSMSSVLALMPEGEVAWQVRAIFAAAAAFFGAIAAFLDKGVANLEQRQAAKQNGSLEPVDVGPDQACWLRPADDEQEEAAL